MLASGSYSVMSDSLWPQWVHSPWNSPGHNTGVGSLSLLQQIFVAQESNWVTCIAGGFFTNWAIRDACKVWNKLWDHDDYSEEISAPVWRSVHLVGLQLRYSFLDKYYLSIYWTVFIIQTIQVQLTRIAILIFQNALASTLSLFLVYKLHACK